MPRNGSGGYSPPAGQPVVSGTAISSTVFNALVADLGSELTKSICTDGQTPMTANLPMGNNRITNLAAGVAAGDAVRLDQVSEFLPLAGGTLTGPVVMVNGTSYSIKDSGDAARLLFGMGGDNQLNFSVAGGNSLNIYNQAVDTINWSIDNVGNVFHRGSLILPNNVAIKMKTADNTARTVMQIASNNNVQHVNAGGTNWQVLNQAANTAIMNLTDAGVLTAPTITATSDERKKKLWQRLPKDFIRQLAGIKKSGLFTWRKGGARGIGVGAQSLEAIFPEAVHTDEYGTKSVNYGPAAMVSVVELARALIEVERRLAKLEQK